MLPIAKPILKNEEVHAAKKVILSGWVTQGPKVAEFEKSFAHYVQSEFACAVSNCTTGLHLALLAVGVKPGDIVITVSHSFIATANAVRYCFAEPVFIDVQEDSFNMSPVALKTFLLKECRSKGGKLFYKNSQRLIKANSPFHFINKNKIGRVAAILAVHQIGIPCDMKAILSLGRKYKLPVVEDAACAIGSEIYMGGRWRKIGKPIGDVVCFSFHPRKILTTGDGGMITTNSKLIDSRLRLLRHQGMNVSDIRRHKSKKVIVEHYPVMGYNYRLTDIQAAVGIEQLRRLPGLLRKRRQLAAYYIKKLKAIDWVETFKESKNIKTNWQSFPVCLKRNAPLSRDRLMQYFLNKGIATRPGIMNAHEQAPYKSNHVKLPASEVLRKQTILLPLFDAMNRKDIDNIVMHFAGFKKVSSYAAKS